MAAHIPVGKCCILLDRETKTQQATFRKVAASRGLIEPNYLSWWPVLVNCSCLSSTVEVKPVSWQWWNLNCAPIQQVQTPSN